MSRLTFILSIVITGAFLSSPPSVRAGLIFYDITATINGNGECLLVGCLVDGNEEVHAFFSYDTDENESSQSSPAGIITPTDVAFTDDDAKINVDSGNSNILRVEASTTSYGLSSYGFSPPGGDLGLMLVFTGPIGLNQALPLLEPVPGGNAVFVTGILSLDDGRSFTVPFGPTNIVQRLSPIPEPSTLLLLVSGGLVGLGVRRWRQRRERPTLAAA